MTSILPLQKQIRKTGRLMSYTASIKNRCIPVALQHKNVLIGDKLHIPHKNKCNIVFFYFFQPVKDYFISFIVNKNFGN